jgi:hypothetical protein
VSTVCASGRHHCVDPNDIYGSLFFHVKDELKEFSRRVKNFNIDFHMTQMDATDLSAFVSSGIHDKFKESRFDRVETSNLADYVGASTVINDWGPLLNAKNKHSAVLVYFMNWYMREAGARIGSENSRGLRDIMETTAKAMVTDWSLFSFSHSY